MNSQEIHVEVGMMVRAKKRSEICRAGERGVCYHEYELKGKPGYSFIFEKGGYDDFSPREVEMFLEVSGNVCESVAEYQFRNVIQLSKDFAAGRFKEAFRPEILTEKIVQKWLRPCDDLPMNRQRVRWIDPGGYEHEGIYEKEKWVLGDEWGYVYVYYIPAFWQPR